MADTTDLITSSHLLTSLFNSIAAIQPAYAPPLSSKTPSSINTGFLAPKSSYGSSQIPNPLRHLPLKARNLFLTAHCLLPSTFLHALDLLEKGLVVQYATTPSSSPPSHASPKSDEDRASPAAETGVSKKEESATPPTDTASKYKENIDLNHPKQAANDPPREITSPDPSAVYYIRSTPAATTDAADGYHISRPNFTSNASTKASSGGSSSKGKMSGDGNGGFIYEVRPHVWNCTCIAFTLAAYQQPSKGASTSQWAEYILGEDRGDGGNGEHDEDELVDGAGGLPGGGGQYYHTDGGELWWGGVSAYRIASGIPICKHLLAAVLVERCPVLFRPYLIEKVVSVEEMAEMGVAWD